jgi:formiminotetrahydrofolate cyclodeaminase
MLTDRPVHELLARFASPAPTPGGGSASALAGALGVSLLIMVARLPKTRSGNDPDRAALAEAEAALVDLQRRLSEAVDNDAASYDRVVVAYRLPKGSEVERLSRSAAIADALRASTDIPLQVMRWSVLALAQAILVAAHGNPSASSDVGTAVALLNAACEGARLNVEINLRQIAKAGYVNEARETVERLSREAAAAVAESKALLN